MGSTGAETVSAIIIHYRTPAETVATARAVAATTPASEVLVVDNSSRDRIEQRIAAERVPARVVTAAQNRGYGAGCNLGAAATSRPFLLFLNSDAEVHPGAVDRLVAALETNPLAAAAAPRLENPDGTLQPSIQRLPTAWRVFCESSGLARLSGGRPPFRGHSATREDHSRSREVESVKGAALLVRRSAFDAVGGFDENFFLYGEETDLIARWRRGGWTVIYEPSAVVTHEGGASGGDALFAQVHEGLARHVRKHEGRFAGAVASAALRTGAAVRYLLSLLTPGERGRSRRLRYRSALSGPPRRA